MDPLEQSTPTTPPAPAPKRRGCLGCFLTSGLGCTAFLFGSFVAALGFAPSMLGGVAARGLEASINNGIDGRVEIREMRLAWDSLQKIQDLQLFDPEGELVLGLELTLPSLLTLFESKRKTWNVRLRVQEANLRFDSSGLSNLDRALAYQDQLLTDRSPKWNLDEFDPQRLLSQPFPYDLSIKAPRDSVRITLEQDAEAVEGAPVSETVVRLNGFQLDLNHRPGERDDLKFEARIESGEHEGQLEFEGGFVRAGGRLADVDAELTLAELPTAIIDALAGWDAGLAELMGPSLDGTLSLVGDLGGEARFEAQLKGSLQGPDDASIELSGALTDGVLRPGEEGRFEGRVLVPERLCERVLSPLLPGGMQVVRDTPRMAWDFEGRDFAFNLGLGTPAGFSLGPLLEDLGGVMELRPESSLRCVSAEGDLDLLSLSDVVVDITLAAGSMPRLDLDAVVEDPDGHNGALRLSLVARDGFAALRDGNATVGIELSGQAGSLDTSGELEAGILQGARMQLSLPSGSPSRRELLALLLPWIQEVEARAVKETLVLTLVDYRLPMNGDLREVRGQAILELGRTTFRVHQAFHGLFHAADDDPDEIEQVFLPVHLTIDRGIVTYEELSLDIGGGICDIRGKYDLSDQSLDLRSDVPVALVLRRENDEELAVPVPVTISGTWPDPQLLMNRELMDAITGGVGKLMEWLSVFGGDSDR